MRLKPRQVNIEDGWQLCMAGHGMFTALSWAMSPHLFSTQTAYRVLATLVSRPNAAIYLGLYSITSILVVLYSSVYLRAMFTILGSGIWMFLGLILLLASTTTEYPYLSPAGMFELFAGFGCLFTVSQWGKR